MKNNKILCILLVILVFLSGNCFEKNRIEPAIMGVPATKTDSYIGSLDKSITDENLCTREASGLRNSVSSLQLKGRFVSQKRELRPILSFLCADAFAVLSRMHLSVADMVFFIQPHHDKVVINYIHSSDGKK